MVVAAEKLLSAIHTAVKPVGRLLQGFKKQRATAYPVLL